MKIVNTIVFSPVAGELHFKESPKICKKWSKSLFGLILTHFSTELWGTCYSFDIFAKPVRKIYICIFRFRNWNFTPIFSWNWKSLQFSFPFPELNFISVKLFGHKISVYVSGLLLVLTLFKNKKVVIALAGNKIDLESQRAVDHEEVKIFAEQNGLIFMETSAKLAKNFQEIFLMIAKNLPIDN